jgi:hypothetical protein
LYAKKFVSAYDGPTNATYLLTSHVLYQSPTDGKGAFEVIGFTDDSEGNSKPL